MAVHFTDAYFLNPQHKITVSLVGVGGTGSRVLTGLASLNEGLLAVGHPGIHVYAFDADDVSEANIGRQLFSPVDVGCNKATILITRINRHFGLNWEAVPEFYCDQQKLHTSNITITCVDSAKERVKIGKALITKPTSTEPFHRHVYWMDYGNALASGQVVLGTLQPVKQPKSKEQTVDTLQTVTKMFPNLSRLKEKNQGPSCSLAEALHKQDLFINPTIAQLGLNLLWKMFREGKLRYHGLYLNLDTMSVNPIKI